ncbi:MAG: glycosyltransferase family 4 protein [Blastochloris sp.]|nr:glycosyltransferase family 4 protein [Blastochloris sp.]
MSDGNAEPRTKNQEPQAIQAHSSLSDETLNPMPLRYVRSVHLQRDFANERLGVRDYQVTPLVIQTTERIVAGLSPGSTARAFSLIGPYGSGKSAYGVFLAHYLQGNAISRQRLLQAHAVTGAPEGVTHDAPMLLPLLISGNNASLRLALIQAMQRLCETHQPLRDKKLRVPKMIAAEVENTNIDPQRVANLLAELNAMVVDRMSFKGLLVVIDELGQFLDYAARQGDERELFTLQTLAEMAARSGDTPCVVLTILHQSFDRYTVTAGAGRRTEWAKVQGRYVDLPFQEPPIQMLRMVSGALASQTNDLPVNERQQWLEKVTPASDQVRPADVGAEEWRQLIARAYPLHPTVLVALPQLFRQLAQNERSLFAFLTSREPWSVQDFLLSAPADDNTSRVYRLPHLGIRRYPIAPAVLSLVSAYDVVHIHAIDFFVDFLVATRRLHRRPIIVNTHGGIFHTRWLLPIKKLFFQTITRQTLRGTAAIVCDSQHDYALFRAIAPAHRLHIIANGIDIEPFLAIEKRIQPGLLLGIGRIVENKRVADIIDLLPALAAHIPDVRLVWIGADQEHQTPALLQRRPTAWRGRARAVCGQRRQRRFARLAGPGAPVCLCCHL